MSGFGSYGTMEDFALAKSPEPLQIGTIELLAIARNWPKIEKITKRTAHGESQIPTHQFHARAKAESSPP